MKRRASRYAGIARLPMIVIGCLLSAGLLLSACVGPPTPTPIPRPTATPTPRSTPLPEVPTAIPLAAEANPLVVLMLPQGGLRAAQDAAGTLGELILELRGLAVDIQPVNSYGEIVAQLCSANPVAGWVDGLSYIIAEAQGCADPALLVERGGATGFRVDMLAASGFAGSDVSNLDDRTLCRLNDQDVYSWLVPGLMLHTSDVDPLYDLEEVIEVEDYDALVAAIYNGDCDAGGVPHGYLDEGGPDLAALEDLRDEVIVLAESPEIPYDILVYPQTVPLNVRIPLNDVFVELATNEANASILYDILGQDSIQRVGREDFNAFRAFMVSTNLNFVALGE